jgi:hypothetical protein
MFETKIIQRSKLLKFISLKYSLNLNSHFVTVNKLLETSYCVNRNFKECTKKNYLNGQHHSVDNTLEKQLKFYGNNK